MRKSALLLLFMFIGISAASAQTATALRQKSVRGSQAAYSQRLQQVKEAERRQQEAAVQNTTEKEYSAKYMRSGSDARTARNIKVVYEVASLKLGDEKLAKELAHLENNREYDEKMQKIMDNLSNEKMRNSKNQEIIRILDEAGNKIYNLLAN